MEFFDIRKMPVSLWRNGAGETREICCFPPATRDFHWRASIATINIMTRRDCCRAKVRVADRTFTTFGSRGGVVFVLSGAWQLGDKLLTADQGASWEEGTHTLRLLEAQGTLLFSEITWLPGH